MDLDKVDYILIRLCKDRPGRQLSDLISNFMEILPVGLPLLGEKALRDRLDKLADSGYIRLDRTTLKRRVFCYITQAGEEYIEGRMTAQSSED